MNNVSKQQNTILGLQSVASSYHES